MIGSEGCFLPLKKGKKISHDNFSHSSTMIKCFFMIFKHLDFKIWMYIKSNLHIQLLQLGWEKCTYDWEE